MSEAMIEISGLTKRFGRKQVLDGVDLSVPRGSIFGFLGLNGSGNTTTIRAMLGLLRPDGGTCRVAGVDPARDSVEVRRRVGYMAENQTMYGWMTVARIIDWCGRFYPKWDEELAAQLRDQMGLDVRASTPTRTSTARIEISSTLPSRRSCSCIAAVPSLILLRVVAVPSKQRSWQVGLCVSPATQFRLRLYSDGQRRPGRSRTAISLESDEPEDASVRVEGERVRLETA